MKYKNYIKVFEDREDAYSYALDLIYNKFIEVLEALKKIPNLHINDIEEVFRQIIKNSLSIEGLYLSIENLISTLILNFSIKNIEDEIAVEEVEVF